MASVSRPARRTKARLTARARRPRLVVKDIPPEPEPSTTPWPPWPDTSKGFVRIGHVPVPENANPADVSRWLPRHMAAVYFWHSAEAYRGALLSEKSLCEAMDASLPLTIDDGLAFEESHNLSCMKNALIGAAVDSLEAARERLIDAVFRAALAFGVVGKMLDASRLDEPLGLKIRDHLVWLVPAEDERKEPVINVVLVDTRQVDEVDWTFPA